jgi:hypothetical protein
MSNKEFLGILDNSSESGAGDIAPVEPFGGNFFGAKYDEGDFGILDDNEDNFSGILPPDSDNDNDFNQGQGWEPAPCNFS